MSVEKLDEEIVRLEAKRALYKILEDRAGAFEWREDGGRPCGYLFINDYKGLRIRVHLHASESKLIDRGPDGIEKWAEGDITAMVRCSLYGIDDKYQRIEASSLDDLYEQVGSAVNSIMAEVEEYLTEVRESMNLILEEF